MNSLNETSIENNTHYFYDDMINIKNGDLNKIKITEKSYKTIFIYYGYVTINSVNPLYLIIDMINGYTEESNGNKCLKLASTGEAKDTLKKYEKLRDKIRDIIGSIPNN